MLIRYKPLTTVLSLWVPILHVPAQPQVLFLQAGVTVAYGPYTTKIVNMI
jgi:hypothetical protein